MISTYSFLYTLVLFSELSSHLAVVAVPTTKVDDGVTDQDGLGLILGDEFMSEAAVVPPVYRRSHGLGSSVTKDEEERPKIIIVSDMRLKGVHRLNSAFLRSPNLLTDQNLSGSPADPGLKIDRRNTDLDMLRCMVGRVYRPCWEVTA